MDVSKLGMGAMIQMLSGNEESVNALQSSLGKTIKTVKLTKDKDELQFTFTDKTVLTLYDSAQSCCERRYLSCDDNLKPFKGSTLIGVDLVEAKSEEIALLEKDGDYHGEDHEVMFLKIKTSEGVFTVCSHDEHNGYYGGIIIQARAS